MPADIQEAIKTSFLYNALAVNEKNVEVLLILASLGFFLQDKQLSSPSIHPPVDLSACPALKLATTTWHMGLSSHFHRCLWHELGPPS